MTWLRIDDKTHSHPKVLAAGNAAWGLYVRCAAWCCDQLTDGFIPLAVAQMYGSATEIRRCTSVGLWSPVDSSPLGPGPHLHIVDFLEFNQSRASKLAERAAATERQRRGRAAANQHPSLGNVTPMSRRDSAVTHAAVAAVPTRPDPTRFIDDDDNSELVTPTSSSSSDVNYAIGLIAEAITLGANPTSGRRRAFLHGTRKNLLAEHATEIAGRLATGASPLQVATDWVGSASTARLALRNFEGTAS